MIFYNCNVLTFSLKPPCPRRRRPRRPHAAQLGAAAHFDGAEQLRRLEVVQPRVGVGRLAARARALQRARDVEVAVVAGAFQSMPSQFTIVRLDRTQNNLQS